MICRKLLEQKYTDLEKKYESSQEENQKLKEEVKSLRSDLNQKDEVIARLENKHTAEIKELKNECNEKLARQDGVIQNLQLNVSVLMNMVKQLSLNSDGYVVQGF